MKKYLPVLMAAILFFAPNVSGSAQQAFQKAPAGSPVARYGRLKVVGNRICDERGKPVALRGMSTAGLQWYGETVNTDAFRALARDWKCDVIRLALYVGEGGYADNPELKDLVLKGVDLAIANGLYVIVDWHVLDPGDPNDPVYAGAEQFFRDMAKRYGKTANLIYEIMNEPNGPLVWARDLKPYAVKMTAAIRSFDPDNLIFIGSGTWSQDVDIAAADPVPGKNLAYTVHFYAGTHGQWLKDKIQTALNRGAAVFCSEWGTSEATGDGGPYLDRAEEWLAFLAERDIGWTNWSLCDKDETSAAFKSAEGRAGSPLVPTAKGKDGSPVWTVDQLTAGGAYVRARLRGEAPARPAESPASSAAGDAGSPSGPPWTFEDGTRQGWTVGADSPVKVKPAVSAAETKALTFAYAWTAPGPPDPWSVAPRLVGPAVNLPAAGHKILALDLYLEAGKAKTGGLQIQAVVQSPQHGYWFQLPPVTPSTPSRERPPARACSNTA
jgi:endoglucanase